MSELSNDLTLFNELVEVLIKEANMCSIALIVYLIWKCKTTNPTDEAKKQAALGLKR